MSVMGEAAPSSVARLMVSGNVPVLCSPASGSTFPLGTTTVNCSAKDAAGNVGTASFKIAVQDTTPPTIASVTPSEDTLWPPNHKMVPMSVNVAVNDAVDGAPACRVAAIVGNEPVNGLGDGDTTPDWIIGNGLTFQLRAERSGKGRGRVYTITVECRD